MVGVKSIFTLLAVLLIGLVITACAVPQASDPPQDGTDSVRQEAENGTLVIKKEGSSNIVLYMTYIRRGIIRE